MAGLIAFETGALAHEGHDHGPATPAAPPVAAASPPSAAPVGASPRRLPDGTVILPAETQRLLGIRTEPAKLAEAAPELEIFGRVIADPNASAKVQAVRDGRIDPPEKGFPYPGQRVAKGDELAVLTPTLSVMDEATLRQNLVQIEKEMSSMVTRADAIGPVSPTMPMGDATVGLLQDLQIQSQGLTRQREVVEAALKQSIKVTAPLAGVVVSLNVATGQIAAARDLLFEIVDPGRVLVEAFSFDDIALEDIVSAEAVADSGARAPLALVARGQVLRQQAIPFTLRPRENAALPIGSFVTVRIATRVAKKGVRLPSAALERQPGGGWAVWLQQDANAFRQISVTASPLGNDAMLVGADGLVGQRVVVNGAAFISQVR